MTRKLRDALHRIGESAPVADVDDDTWARARRARSRDRALAVAAVVAVVALVGGLVGGIVPFGPTLFDQTPVAGSATDRVPNHVWEVPEGIAEMDLELNVSGDVETDLAVGRGALAFVTYDGIPVVVDAASGDYHLLALPGLNGRLLRGDAGVRSPLTLSPDGRLLAFPWLDPDSRTEGGPMPSGVRVVDLVTGAVRTIALQGGQGVMIDSIDWSPDSGWIVWNGAPTSRWDAPSSYTTDGKLVAGRIAPGSTTSEAAPVSRDSASRYVVSDSGEVAVVATNLLIRWGGDRAARTRTRARGTFPIAAAARGADVLALRTEGGSYGYLLRAHGAAGTRALELPEEVQGADLRALGWLDDDHLLARVGPPGDALRDLAVIGVGERPTYRVVGGVDELVPEGLSVAVDLMALDHPTVERPEPDWPWSDELRSLAIGLGVAAALALLYAARWLWRRPGRR